MNRSAYSMFGGLAGILAVSPLLVLFVRALAMLAGVEGEFIGGLSLTFALFGLMGALPGSIVAESIYDSRERRRELAERCPRCRAVETALTSGRDAERVARDVVELFPKRVQR